MEEENSVIAEETATDDASEEQTDIEDSSESEEEDDNSSEEMKNTETDVENDKQPRANKRIRELIKQRNEWKEKYIEAAKNRPQGNGVDEDGIDPNKFRESLKSDILAETAGKNLDSNDTQLKTDALKDFDFMKEEIWQIEATNYVKQGYDPYTAAQMVEKKINYLRGIEKKNVELQNKADQKHKSNSYQTSGSTKANDGIFTQEQIEKMSHKEYEKNLEKINDQLSRGLIK